MQTQGLRGGSNLPDRSVSMAPNWSLVWSVWFQSPRLSYWGEVQTPKHKLQQPHWEGSSPLVSPLQGTHTFKVTGIQQRRRQAWPQGAAVHGSGSQSGKGLPPKGSLAKSRDIFGCPNLGGGAIGIGWAEPRGATLHPTRHRPAPLPPS